ncbi:hypothetical protein [Ammoniphilus resinae]|uniref:TM2 domain-containing membrane protein YozV n=1 Tax=Ammoniphilus resinae TaxID=861532 RepID=A0ABS4GUL7_9BACL|nr:hypothetical protein [Ammoniphilus resinae]MBP1933960.1 TM2 domain-containing membrane protein YozV [Ammoniphilus resinae]
MKKRYEVILWSIALPGFGQFLNGKYVKGIVFILLEFVINVKANLNTVIIFSFLGQIDEAIQQTDYQWLMFYPCLYLFAIWDAYRDAYRDTVKEPVPPFIFLRFVMAAFLGTVGVVYSSIFTLFGMRFGPVWLPIICLILGVFLGYFIEIWMERKQIKLS